jgi:tyrosyl-tRNA synthetase
VNESSDKNQHLPEVERQMHLLLRGTEHVISAEQLRARITRSLIRKTPLRVKLGVDPTAASLHLGFTLGLRKLRQFQDLGHIAVLIIGDATAMVGDPTGRNKARPRLDAATVDANATHYLEQAMKILSPERLEVRRNGEWLKRLDFTGFIELASRSTVARMLERDDFSKRWKEGVAIQLHEFLYPLLQGTDSVAIQADVELGGSDQLFNLLVGRDLQEQHGQEPQICLTTPLLLGLDGQRKMSKTYDNWIGINESPDEMMLKVMRISDSMLRDWMLLLTDMSDEEIAAALHTNVNPRDSKLELGRRIVAGYWGKDAAVAAAEGWLKRVSRKEVDAASATILLPDEWRHTPPTALELLMHTGWFQSKGEARRQLEQRAVSLNERRIENSSERLALEVGAVLRVGKQRLATLQWKALD